MASLNVADVSRITSNMSSPSSWMYCRIAGTVASPTPIVPMSEDSTNVMSRPRWESRCASAAAVIQPAVPPPAMTTRLAVDVGPEWIMMASGANTSTDLLFDQNCSFLQDEFDQKLKGLSADGRTDLIVRGAEFL